MPTELPETDESFDWASYLDRYPDLRLAGIEDEAAATRHWLAYGRAEGRDGTPRPRAQSHSLACPSEASLYLRATGDLVCWDDAGNATVLQPFDATRNYAYDVWLGEPYEAVRGRLRAGRLPFPEVCARCLALRARPTFASEAVARRRIEVFQLEPSYHCSLDCPGCVPLAVRRHAPPQHLEAGVLEKILRDLEQAGIAVGAFDFQGHGEPLLHPDVWGLARLVRNHFSTSYLSMTTNAHGVVDPSRLVGSFDEVVCAIDGTCSETYAVYRVGGRFELAWRFLVDLAAARRATAGAPRVVWKYVLFAHNSSMAELEEARRRSAELGLDELRFVFTRNGPPAQSVAAIEAWLGDDQGPRISLQRHEPSPLELASRLAEAERRLDQEAEARGEGAWELALSVGRNLERFFPDGEALPPSFAEVEEALRLTLGRLVEAESGRLPEALEKFLPVADDEGESRHRPSTVDAARTVDLIRESRRLLAYAPLVTGLRPVYKGADELYPQFVESAVGCELVDTTGRTLIDWMSGYGSVVLGYRDPEVEAAVIDQMRCGPVVPFGHPLEVEVARRLVEAIPCAESVGFGKNGSDAVTAAVRLARLATGREMVLYHGYHGFHDWFAAGNPAVGGIPAGLRELVAPFAWGDLEALERLLARHRGRVAAVCLEPAKQQLPPSGWLEGVRDLAHQHGALLIFDEIVTGFRIARGGGQELFGVLPDLAAFGKAMANGWPISAVVGRRDLLRRWPEIGVDMTWRSETLSLAAARVVLDVLTRRPVLSHLAAVGDRLRSGFASAARTAGVDATLTGPSARLTIAFRDQAGLSAHRLLEQFLDECLRRGVVTNGTLLPNAAHDERATERTLEVFRQALAVLGRGVDLGRLDGPGAPRGPWIQGCVDQASERAGRVELAGWLLAEDGRSLTIDLVAPDGQVIPAERVRRTDVAAAFPWTRGAQDCGWSVRLPPAGTEGSERVAPLVLRARYGGRVVFRCGLVVPPSRMPLGEAVALSAGGLVEI